MQLRYQLYSNYVLYELKLDKSQKYIVKYNIKYTILKSSFSTFDSEGEILQ
jgi:hypothetical protein